MQRVSGPKVLVTRPSDQALSWVSALRAEGVDAVAAPLISIADAPDPAAVDAVWASIERWSLLVFVSPNAVTRFFARRPSERRWPPGLRAAAPGPGTSSLLRECGVPAAQVLEPAADSENFDSEALWEVLAASDWRGARVLIVRGDGGRDWLATRFAEAGVGLEFLTAYRREDTSPTESMRMTLQQALARPAEHLWLFSSSESITGLLKLRLLADADLQRALGHARALCTHPRIAEAASAAGFGTVLESRPGVADVLACIQSLASLDDSSAPRRAP